MTEPKTHAVPWRFGFLAVVQDTSTSPHKPAGPWQWWFTDQGARSRAVRAWEQLNRQDRRDEQEGPS